VEPSARQTDTEDLRGDGRPIDQYLEKTARRSKKATGIRIGIIPSKTAALDGASVTQMAADTTTAPVATTTAKRWSDSERLVWAISDLALATTNISPENNHSNNRRESGRMGGARATIPTMHVIVSKRMPVLDMRQRWAARAPALATKTWTPMPQAIQ
jgi:hypothetical protein